jgi:hypothetical protein
LVFFLCKYHIIISVRKKPLGFDLSLTTHARIWAGIQLPNVWPINYSAIRQSTQCRTEPYHLRSWKSSAGAVLLIWAVWSFINGYDLTIINSPVHQNSCLDFPTAVVISLSRCDFPAVISAQKISAETVRPCRTLSILIVWYRDMNI